MQHRPGFAFATALLAVVALAGACADRPAPDAAALEGMSLVDDAAGDEPVVLLGTESLPLRPRGIAIPVPLDHLVASGAVPSWRDRAPAVTAPDPETGIAFAGPGQPPLPVFLNRFGGTYTPGPDNSRNNTSIVPNQPSTIGAYSYGDASWNQVVSCLETMFEPYNVVMVQQEPASGEYVESVIGGRPQDVGLPNGVGGVAPIDNFSCNLITRAIVYTFSDVYGNNPQAICETAAQEIAHAFSLDHELHCPDPMTYLNGCGAKTFRDFDAQCGEFQPRACNCGRPRQNSVRILTEKLGVGTGVEPPEPIDDPTPPVVALTSPSAGATLPANSSMQITATVSDDIGLAAVDLLWDFNDGVFPCPGSAQGGAVNCTRSGNTHTWTLNVGQGSRTFSVRARDVGGNVVTSPERTISLGDGSGVPGDTTAPAVSVVSPANNAVLAANTTIQVSAQATDNNALASVELLWTFGDNVFLCPFDGGQGVSCTQNGSTFTWSLTVGVGTRAFSVRARDTAGNTVTTTERTITLSTDPDAPVDPPVGDDDPAEPNNSPADAFSLRCGNAIDLVASPGDEDWFAVEAPADTTVEVAINSGAALSLAAFSPDGQTELAAVTDAVADGPVRVTSPGPAVLVRIAGAAENAAYRLTASCGGVDGDPIGEDDLEPNNVLEDAVRSFCGQERTGLVAADADYFVLEVRDNDVLTVDVESAGATAAVLDAEGEVVAGPAASVTAEGLRGGDVYVRVEPQTGTTGYDVNFTCAPLAPAVSGGCAASSVPKTAAWPAGLVLVGLGVLLRRRR